MSQWRYESCDECPNRHAPIDIMPCRVCIFKDTKRACDERTQAHIREAKRLIVRLNEILEGIGYEKR